MHHLEFTQPAAFCTITKPIRQKTSVSNESIFCQLLINK